METITLTGNDAAMFLQKMLRPNVEAMKRRDAFVEQIATDHIDYDGVRAALERRIQET